MRPESFAAELSTEWSRWVLQRGLPELPDGLALGESVPVSRWVGPRTAAVLHLRHLTDEDGGRPFVQADVECFALVDGAWELTGSGGSGDDPSVDFGRADVPPVHVDLSGLVGGWSDGRGCTALWGEVGSAAAVIEVAQAGEVTRRQVESPLGWLAVSADAAEAFVVRVFDARGELLAEVGEPAADAEGGWLS